MLGSNFKKKQNKTESSVRENRADFNFEEKNGASLVVMSFFMS